MNFADGLGLCRSYIFLVTLMATLSSPVYAADPTPKITVGTQEVGLSVGYLLPHRLTQDHTTKQQVEPPSCPPG